MSKNIVMFFDGTGNEIGSNDTNVVKLLQACTYGPNQILYYTSGIGTINLFGSPYRSNAWKLLELGLGYGTEKNITMAYQFLMENYEDGDKIYLFGFSRGAIAARGLAGLLSRIGLLFRGNADLVPQVNKLYWSHSRNQDFSDTVCRKVTPYFIGVWDTVAALGYLYSRVIFLDQSLHPEIPYAYQALAIDEHREKFLPLIWDESQKGPNQTIKQVWFKGAHQDIGGGYPEPGLSNISLRWMQKQAEKAGLMTNGSRLPKGNPTQEPHNSRTCLWKLWPSINRYMSAGSHVHYTAAGEIPECSMWMKIEFDD